MLLVLGANDQGFERERFQKFSREIVASLVVLLIIRVLKLRIVRVHWCHVFSALFCNFSLSSLPLIIQAFRAHNVAFNSLVMCCASVTSQKCCYFVRFVSPPFSLQRHLFAA